MRNIVAAALIAVSTPAIASGTDGPSLIRAASTFIIGENPPPSVTIGTDEENHLEIYNGKGLVWAVNKVRGEDCSFTAKHYTNGHQVNYSIDFNKVYSQYMTFRVGGTPAYLFRVEGNGYCNSELDPANSGKMACPSGITRVNAQMTPVNALAYIMNNFCKAPDSNNF